MKNKNKSILSTILALNVALPMICVNGVDTHAVNIDEYDLAEKSVEMAELTKIPADIEKARLNVNKLPEGIIKEQLQERLNNIVAIIIVDSTANVDVFINSTSTLNMTIDTNIVTFEEFDGVEDMVKENAINVTVKSSLPYKLNAYLLGEIVNGDGSKMLDKSVLNIKANAEEDYQTFSDIGVTPIKLVDSQNAGAPNRHGIDLKLDSSVDYETDDYKTTIKFEATQE